MIPTWREFWNSEHSIYVSKRHLEANYTAIGHDVRALAPSTRPLVLLDWGCGDALSSPMLASVGIEVLLYDPVPRVFERINTHFKDSPHIRVLSLEDYVKLPQASIDVVLVHSVLQYLSKEEFTLELTRLREVLRPGGLLLLGDVVPPNLPMRADVEDLLVAGMRHGFLIEAVFGLMRTFFSNYRSIRRENGFTTYSVGEISEILASKGFKATHVRKNIGLCRHRMLIRAERA